MLVRTPDEKKVFDEITTAAKERQSSVHYVTDSDEDWEVVHRTEGEMNRLVMWPGTILHSIDIRVAPETGTLPDKRLTQRVLVNSI